MSDGFDADLPADIAPDFSAFYRRLQDISTYQLDRLRGVTSASLLQEYEAELSESFADVESRLQALQLASDDYDRQVEVAAVSQEAAKASAELQQTRQASREALLAARRGLSARSEAAARAELNLGQGTRERSKLADRSADDKLHTASEDVTDALRRTVALMSQELEKSTFSAQMLDESSSALRTISLEYTSFSSLVKSSTQLIKSMERQDLYDRIMVLASFIFFLACVGYILKVRIWDRGASLLAFLFRALTFGWGGRSQSAEQVMTSMKIAKSAAKESGKSVLSAVAASAASASSSLSVFGVTESVGAAVTSAVIVASGTLASEQPSAETTSQPAGQEGPSQGESGQAADAATTSAPPVVNIGHLVQPKSQQRVLTRPVEKNDL